MRTTFSTQRLSSCQPALLPRLQPIQPARRQSVTTSPMLTLSCSSQEQASCLVCDTPAVRVNTRTNLLQQLVPQAKDVARCHGQRRQTLASKSTEHAHRSQQLPQPGSLLPPALPLSPMGAPQFIRECWVYEFRAAFATPPPGGAPPGHDRGARGEASVNKL